MSDNDSYQASITQLKDWYKLATDNSGNQQFYIYLFNYVKTIDANEHLKDAANLFWFIHLVNDHKDDKDMHALLEKLMVDAKSEPDSKKKVENTLSLLKIAMSDDIKEVQLYYSWILLDVMFYGVYKLKAGDLKEVDFDTIDYNKVLGIEVSFTQIEEMRSRLKQAYQVSDSSSTPFTRDTFVTALHVFHTEFINWLPENFNGLSTEKGAVAHTSSTLPKTLLKVGEDFAIHEHNIVSYKGDEINLESQEARIVAFIMRRSITGAYTSAEHISAEVLKGETDSLKPEAYVRKIISNARKAFKLATKSDTNYFKNKHSIGYKFNY